MTPVDLILMAIGFAIGLFISTLFPRSKTGKHPKTVWPGDKQ